MNACFDESKCFLFAENQFVSFFITSSKTECLHSAFSSFSITIDEANGNVTGIQQFVSEFCFFNNKDKVNLSIKFYVILFGVKTWNLFTYFMTSILWYSTSMAFELTPFAPVVKTPT